MVVVFKGFQYKVIALSHVGSLIVKEALRKGLLNHVGSLREQIIHNVSASQVYNDPDTGLLVAASVSYESQWIDYIWRLERI
jgi:hypothetical protein